MNSNIAGAGPNVAVDARMMWSSGIGRYLQNVVPRVFDGSPDLRPALLGDVDALRGALGKRMPGAVYRRCSAPVYSIREQLELARGTPGGVRLFWAPHYNIPLLRSGELLVTVHDVLHLALPELIRGWHRRAYARRMLSTVRRRAARIVCVSHFTADELVRLTGVDRSRVVVIHNGVDDWWFERCTESSPHSRPYFLYVGNVKPHKNLGRLCGAFGRIVDRVEEDLVIVGKRTGFIHGDDEVQRSATGLDGRLHFTGELTDGEVRRYVTHATALVLPSRYEGFGLPALEAMAAGRPVAVSRAASLPEVCGDAAIYFDPEREEEIASALRTLARDGVLREALGAAGRERAGRFTWSRCAAETREVITEVLRG